MLNWTFFYLLNLFLEITKRGGQGIPVYVDHANDTQVKQLFEQIANENKDQLDILVNNAFAAGNVNPKSSLYFF